MAKCLLCGRKINSDKSLASGVGSGCRHKPSKRANHWQRRLERTVNLKLKKPIIIGSTTWKYYFLTDAWVSNKGSYFKHKDFVKWMMDNKQVIVPEKDEIDPKLLEEYVEEYTIAKR